jgi:hypothetical protein
MASNRAATFGIAEEVVALHDDVADMDANAEPHCLAFGPAGIFLTDRLLDRNRALNGIDRAGEIGNDTIARGIEDPSAMRSDQPVHDLATVPQPRERADLVLTHQPAVAGDVSREDS